MSTTTTTTTTGSVVTPDQAAEMFRLATTSATKWSFLDGVASMCAARPSLSQKEVVDMIGDTAVFVAMHGDHRDDQSSDAKKKTAARNAKSKLKSIRDELSVVKVWAPGDRVTDVSFEAHKVLNRLGSQAGGKILTALVKEMGGPGNVTKAAVVARLRVADPDHVPQANGKPPAATSTPSLPGTATAADLSKIDLSMLASALADRLTVGDLAKDAQLAKIVERVADTFEGFAQRKAAKAAGTARSTKSAPVKKTAAKRPAASSSAKRKTAAVKTPAAPKRAAVKVKAPA